MKHYTLITPPTQEPISVADAVGFLRSSGSAEESALIAAFISAARETVENFTGRSLLTTGWKVVADGWSGNAFTLDRTPLVSVSAVKYYAEGATTLTTLDTSAYALITTTQPGQVLFMDEPPALAERPDAVQIDFTAGAASPDLIPPTLIHAVRLLAQNYYDNRAAFAASSVNEIPLGLRHLLESQRVGGWVA